MNQELVDNIVNAVLYEGYILYPYRASAKKNRQRFTFGRVYPEAYGMAQQGAEPSIMQTECLVKGHSPALEVKVRFLQPMARDVGGFPSSAEENKNPDSFRTVPELRVDDKIYQSWHEAVERKVVAEILPLRSLLAAVKNVAFRFPESRTVEPIYDSGKRPAHTILRVENCPVPFPHRPPSGSGRSRSCVQEHRNLACSRGRKGRL